MWLKLIISAFLLAAAQPAEAQIFGGCQSFGGGSAPLAPSPVSINVVTGQLTSAQIKALKATPISLISAGGSSTVVCPIHGNTDYHRVTASYTTGTAGIDFVHTGSTPGAALEVLSNTGLTAAGDRWAIKNYELALPDGAENLDIRNVAVQAKNISASEYAAGSGNVSYEIIYTTFTTP